MLKVNDLRVSYGSIQALKGISFEVLEGEIVSLIGSNGAGKTTTLRTISRLERAKSGEIEFMGQSILKLAAEKVTKAGISHIPEGRRIFPNLNVFDNLMLGAVLRKDKEGIKSDLKWVFEMFPRLDERRKQQAGTLSGGEQQMLAVGRALMTRGKLLMLDEPSMGLAPMLVDSIFETIVKINKEFGMPILLVEQNAFKALQISKRAYILETGVIKFCGSGMKLLNDPRVKEAYLGI
jgi:branched-chain amino acid transport system ATP-binding protein